MHCVWTGELIFLKPLPACICLYAFWEHLFDSSNEVIDPEDRERLVATLLGFLRTYTNLIQHRSDFFVARKHVLLSSFDHTTFQFFSHFIMAFDALLDSAISSRWRFGELPLEHLNFYSAVSLHK
ncbi:hypothetical protein K469DRAFT_796206 [Zopfia rhizophila CBS 207.26]|uniref:Uncharacterized protein n=1 Tax=Zopfia rhizophila CBS 207.26 TaxID=1314779 RepID=A0A6A6EPR8_9PEZI|nr:hypothetical protein K469DRAFT_796206 [Zopfia rhizophila CBS 207.26]